MIEERAVVTRVDNGQVYVQAVNIGNCQRCAEGNGCGGGLLGRLARHRQYSIAVQSRVTGLRAGDAVVLGISGDALLSASALVYLLPLVGMIGFGVLASHLLNANDLLVAAFAVAGLASGLLVVRWRSQSADVLRFQPLVLRRDTTPADHCPRITE